jgi:ADP-ribose pyrophosphatase YjhB (NUDIX family)
MSDLLKYTARICHTASGFVIVDQKILLVKHKKLGFWLAPGGHVNEGELLHHAAVREVFEETGLRVQIINPWPALSSKTSTYIPSPFSTNLHWISKDRYQQRIASKDPDKPQVSSKWPLGCEQHINYGFLAIPTPLHQKIVFDQVETDGINWFSEEEVRTLETTQDIKQEIECALKLMKNCKIR